MQGKHREPRSQQRTLHLDFIARDGAEVFVITDAKTGAVLREVPVPVEVRND